MKIWTCRSSPRSVSRNAWARTENVSGACPLRKFWNFFCTIQMILCRDWWPWTKPGYITMIRRQRHNQWSGAIEAHPDPKKSAYKNLLEKFSPRFKTASSSLIIFQRAKLSTRSVTHLCWCNWRTFWRKTPREGHQRDLVLARQAPAHQALATQKTLAYLGFHCLDHQPHSLDLAPSDYHLFPGLKNNWKVANFRPTQRTLLLRRPVWTDKLLIFFEWLAKVRVSD